MNTLPLFLARISLAFIFLWAFADKLLGLGISTPAERAVLAGGSATAGFLAKVSGPFAWLFNGLAGNPMVELLFLAGLFGIGMSLAIGRYARIAGWSGAVLMLLMWLAVLPIKSNPFVDDHVVYLFVLIAYAMHPEMFAFPRPLKEKFFASKAQKPLV